jgi:hypothetical protein
MHTPVKYAQGGIGNIYAQTNQLFIVLFHLALRATMACSSWLSFDVQL